MKKEKIMNKRQKQLKRICGNKTHRYKIKQLWNLNDYLSEHIYYALKQFKELQELYSYPGELKSVKKWEEILDKMIWSFREIKDGYINDPLMEYLEKHNKNDSNSEKLLNEERKNQELYCEKIQEGLDLFAKYIQHLWT